MPLVNPPIIPSTGAADPEVAHIAQNGSDTTGDGTPANPLATVQRAYNLGLRSFFLHAVNGGDLNCGPGQSLNFAGYTAAISAVGAIAAPGDITITGDGNVTLGSLTATTASASDGSAPAIALVVHLDRVVVSGDVLLQTGNGGPGAAGAGATQDGDSGGPGGNASDGGAITLVCARSVLSGAFQVVSGNGGTGGGGGSGLGGGSSGAGGNGGAGGNITYTMRQSAFVGGLTVTQGSTGEGGGGSSSGASGSNTPPTQVICAIAVGDTFFPSNWP